VGLLKLNKSKQLSKGFRLYHDVTSLWLDIAFSI